MQKIPKDYTHNWIEKLDGRSKLSRAISDRLDQLQSDLGGWANLSYARQSLCKRALWMEGIIEEMEVAILRGDEVDLGKYTQAVNALAGLWNKLGLERVAKPAPTLTEVIKNQNKSGRNKKIQNISGE